MDEPDRKATKFITSHFYLDDFVQSSEDPNPQPLQHTPLRAIPEEGFRTPAEATDEDLVRMRQGGGNRFGEDDLAGDPEVDALTNNGQGPPSIKLGQAMRNFFRTQKSRVYPRIFCIF